MWGTIASPASAATTSSTSGAGSGTGGLGSAFGGLREPLRRSDSMMDDDEDELINNDSDEDEDGIKFKRGGISLEQAKRIAVSSAWRGLRA